MLFNGSQRGGAGCLAAHLQSPDNDHVDVHELRGFMAQTLTGALNEAYALSRGTRASQFLYSLSINPPQHAAVTNDQFMAAIEEAETRLGLSGQPRGIVFHEKEGRRHAHAVWSRIDVTEMKAVNVAFPKKKLMQLSRELYKDHGWRMPEGFADSTKRDPKNYTLTDYQQAKRIGADPNATQKAISDAWAISDSKAGFVHALEERGFVLARGDRRGFVAVDHHGEIYSVARKAGVKTKVVRDRLGDPSHLQSVDEAKDKIARGMIDVLERFKADLRTRARTDTQEYQSRKTALVQKQRTERKTLAEKQDARCIAEAKTRQTRFRKGFKGLWDRVSGHHKRTKQRNEREAQDAARRDVTEKHDLRQAHLGQRRKLVLFQLSARLDLREQLRTLQRDQTDYAQWYTRGPNARDGPAHEP